MKLGKAISWLKGTLQRCLFPGLEECWSTILTAKEQQLVSILELVGVEGFVLRKVDSHWLGRKPRDREPIARSFVAKAVYGYPFTSSLIEALKTTPSVRRICGFKRVSDIPDQSTFSRAFKEFAESQLGEMVHDALVERYLKPELVGHISRDATAIVGREKPMKKPPKEKPAPKKRGRPAKGNREMPRSKHALRDRFVSQSHNLLPNCPYSAIAAVRNSKGFKETWIGYKLHADVNDCGLPVSVVLTAASVHDSQVAIPLMKMSSAKVDYLYDLMDSAYDAGPIYKVSKSLGHVPIIDKNSRGKEIIPMAPHQAARYNERTAAERFNSRIKEEFGAGNIMVPGAQKVMMHLMFGVVSVFADQLLKLAT